MKSANKDELRKKERTLAKGFRVLILDNDTSELIVEARQPGILFDCSCESCGLHSNI